MPHLPSVVNVPEVELDDDDDDIEEEEDEEEEELLVLEAVHVPYPPWHPIANQFERIVREGLTLVINIHQIYLRHTIHHHFHTNHIDYGNTFVVKDLMEIKSNDQRKGAHLQQGSEEPHDALKLAPHLQSLLTGNTASLVPVDVYI